MKPSEKSPEMENAINNMLGVNRKASIENDVCVFCGGFATEFRDELSVKEYTISGMCQKCQDSVFGGEKQ